MDNGYYYDYHFIINELAEEFENYFSCFRENTEKYITFTVSIEKVTRTDKNGKINYKKYILKLHFIDSARFIASLLSNFVNNLSERIQKIKCKFRHDDKKCDSCGIKYKHCDNFLEYTNLEWNGI